MNIETVGTSRLKKARALKLQLFQRDFKVKSTVLIVRLSISGSIKLSPRWNSDTFLVFCQF